MTEMHTHEYICPYCMAEMEVRHGFRDSKKMHSSRKCPACGSDMIHATGQFFDIRYHLNKLREHIALVDKAQEVKAEC